MLRNCIRVIPTCVRPATCHIIQQCSASTAADAPNAPAEKWDLYAGVLVERLPVISKTLNELEQQFQSLLSRMEFENSLKSDTELRHERELVQADLIKQGKLEVDLDDSSSKITVQDLKDAYSEELKKFTTAPRLTADDHVNKLTSTNRCLEETLYLLLEQKLGKQNHFLLPQGPRLDGETMRQAAERVLKEKCGNQLQVNFYGNAPCGFYKYKYPLTMRASSVGAKVFFYRAALQRGNVDVKVGPKFEWLEKAALGEKFANETYTKSVQKFIL